MVGRAEEHGSLSEEMQGSRKHRSTMDVLLKKTLSFDLCRQQQRTNMALFDNDAASCYDRILVNLAMVCARRLGAPSEAVFAHSIYAAYYVK